MATIRVDGENNGEEWWDAAREWAAGLHRHDIRAAWANALLYIGDGMVIPEAEVEGFTEWAESLLGWDDGPDYAPHPLIIEADS